MNENMNKNKKNKKTKQKKNKQKNKEKNKKKSKNKDKKKKKKKKEVLRVRYKMWFIQSAACTSHPPARSPLHVPVHNTLRSTRQGALLLRFFFSLSARRRFPRATCSSNSGCSSHTSTAMRCERLAHAQEQ